MQELNLKLTVEETNTVLEALGNMPFVKVHSLINKIQQQASQQLQGQNGNGTGQEVAQEAAAQ